MTPTNVPPIHILDLYCGAGGAAMGYHQALTTANIPHTITGVDLAPQPNYPFNFVQGDAIEYLTTHSNEGYDFIHASPPCQAYSQGTTMYSTKRYPDLIAPTRAALMNYGALFVIENVPNAPLLNAFYLCGTMFNLPILRHRYFECRPVYLGQPPHQRHTGSLAKGDYIPVYNNKYEAQTTTGNVRLPNSTWALATWQQAMGIDWMTKQELTQAIPPAYTNYVMERILAADLLGCTAPDPC